MHTLPDPTKSTVDSDTTSIDINLSLNNGKHDFETTFLVDTADIEVPLFRLHFITNIDFNDLHIYVKKPGQSDFSRITETPVKSWFGMSEISGIPAFTFEFGNPELGEWGLRVESLKAPQKIPSADFPNKNLNDIILLLENDSPYRVASHLQSYKLIAGKSVGLAAKLFDERRHLEELRKFRGLNVEATAAEIYDTDMDLPLPKPMIPPFDGAFDFELDVTFPNGKEEKVKMHSGVGNEEGLYFGSVTADQPGKYSAKVKLQATTPEGHQLTRTTHHIFSVVPEDEDISFESEAEGIFDIKSKMLTLHIPISSKSIRGLIGRQVKAYTEIWGSKTKGADTPIAFASGMSIIDLHDKGEDTVAENVARITLKLHADWIALSGVSTNGMFLLKNLYIQDSANSVPLASANSVDLTISQSSTQLLNAHLLTAPKNGEITEEMKKGIRPQRYTKEYRQQITNSGHKLILTHGYCAGGNPFSTTKFENYAEFNDPKKNRNNDEFAQLLGSFGEQFPSFSIVGHSQGGIAALHLLTFYWSSLDLNVQKSDDNFRWIQSVGTPYQGSALAGWGDAGKIFDIGCGTNTDLTPEGSQLWLTGIPSDARKHVYYYYTTYKDWSYCNMAAQAVLSWQNDGTTEEKRAPLPGGKKFGTKKGFCHTEDMKYPPQCKDNANNEIINKKAARI